MSFFICNFAPEFINQNLNVMKKIIVSTFLVLFTSVTFVNANDLFKLNDADIDLMMTQAVDVSNTLSILDFHGTQATLSNPNPWVAFALCWVVGGFGIHRHYLGTRSGMWAIYTFTCGGIFGIVTFIDWIVLLVGAINDDISRFVGNPSFFMWAN